MPETDPGEFVGSAEAASLLSIDRSTLSRRVAAGRVEPAHRLPGPSGAILFRRSDIEALARAERTEASA